MTTSSILFCRMNLSTAANFIGSMFTFSANCAVPGFRRSVERRHMRGISQFPRQRMLSTAVADQQYFHNCFKGQVLRVRARHCAGDACLVDMRSDEEDCNGRGEGSVVREAGAIARMDGVRSVSPRVYFGS